MPDLYVRDMVDSLTPGPEETIVVEDDVSVQLLCGVPFLKDKKKKKSTNKDKEKNEKKIGGDEVRGSESAKPKNGWSQLLTCSSPSCLSADDSFDYTPATIEEEKKKKEKSERKERRRKRKEGKESGDGNIGNDEEETVVDGDDESQYSHADHWDLRSGTASARQVPHPTPSPVGPPVPQGPHTLSTPSSPVGPSDPPGISFLSQSQSSDDADDAEDDDHFSEFVNAVSPASRYGADYELKSETSAFDLSPKPKDNMKNDKNYDGVEYDTAPPTVDTCCKTTCTVM